MQNGDEPEKWKHRYCFKVRSNNYLNRLGVPSCVLVFRPAYYLNADFNIDFRFFDSVVDFYLCNYYKKN